MLLVFAVILTAKAVASDETAVRKLWDRFQESYSRGDADAVASLYRADADRLTDKGEAHGREEIRAQYEAELAEPGATGQPINDRITIRFLRPEVALLDGEADYVEPDGPVTYVYTVILVKDHEQWSIAAGRPRGLARGKIPERSGNSVK